MKAWQVASRIGLRSTWGKVSFSIGAIVLWAARLRRANGPNFTWPLFQFSGLIPDCVLARTSRVYPRRPLPRRTRDDLMATVRPDWREAIAFARSGTRTPKRALLRMVPAAASDAGAAVSV